MSDPSTSGITDERNAAARSERRRLSGRYGAIPQSTCWGAVVTNTQIVALGVRLFSIWLAVYVLQAIPGMWALYTNASPNGSGKAAVIIIAIAMMLVVLVIWFWSHPITVARKLLPPSTLEQPTALPMEQLQRVGFCLLGLWFLTAAVPNAFYEATIYLAARADSTAVFRARDYADMVEVVVQLGIGIWLLFGARGLLGLIWWARTAGTSPITAIEAGSEHDAASEETDQR